MKTKGTLISVDERDCVYLMEDEAKYLFSRKTVYGIKYGRPAKVYAGPNPRPATVNFVPPDEIEFSTADLSKGKRIWGTLEREQRDLERKR